MELKDIIRTRREKLGLTLQDIADFVDVSKPTIQRYESGEIVNLKQGMIHKLSQILQVSPAKLMGWENPEEAVSGIINNRLKETGMTLDEVSKKSGASLYWLQNIDTFIPGEFGDEYEIGYVWITRVAEVLGLPAGTLRAALARQEVPAYDGPVSSPEEDFGSIIDSDAKVNISKDLLSHYNKLNSTGKNEAVKRVEELTHIKKYTVKESTPLHLLPNAAHENENATKEDKAHDEQFWDDFED